MHFGYSGWWAAQLPFKHSFTRGGASAWTAGSAGEQCWHSLTWRAAFSWIIRCVFIKYVADEALPYLSELFDDM
jgi:hypothetical protein